MKIAAFMRCYHDSQSLASSVLVTGVTQEEEYDKSLDESKMIFSDLPEIKPGPHGAKMNEQTSQDGE
jgi:hypothetical protein